MSLSALIADDEPLAREGLRMLLAECSEFSRVLEAKHGAEAVRMIRADKPDVVFLDVQMPDVGGFEVVQSVGPERMPAVVFVTAHDRYAIQAFEINAVDYLLKPVSRERFAEALRRMHERRAAATSDSRTLISLLHTIASPPRYLGRLAIRSVGKTYFVTLADVDWMQAAENYVQLHVGTSRHMVHVPMQTLYESLDPALFLRIHRSFIVNVSRIKEVENAGRGEFTLVLRNGERLQSSRSYHDHVKRWMENPF